MGTGTWPSSPGSHTHNLYHPRWCSPLFCKYPRCTVTSALKYSSSMAGTCSFGDLDRTDRPAFRSRCWLWALCDNRHCCSNMSANHPELDTSRLWSRHRCKLGSWMYQWSSCRRTRGKGSLVAMYQPEAPTLPAPFSSGAHSFESWALYLRSCTVEEVNNSSIQWLSSWHFQLWDFSN